MYSSSSLKAIVWVFRPSFVSWNPASSNSFTISPGPPSSYGVGRYPVSSGSANSSIGPPTAWRAEACSDVLDNATPVRPLGTITRSHPVATRPGLLEDGKPHRHPARVHGHVEA